jgi:hypothetical protein
VSAKPNGGSGHSRLESEEADLRRYLLGQMSEAEEAGVERAYLGSDDALEALRAREDELIEEYLADTLESAERERFERLFLASPARLERLVFLSALQDRAAPAALRLVPGRGTRSWARTAAAVAVVAAAGLFGARALGPRPGPVGGPALPASGPAFPGSSSATAVGVPGTPQPVVSLRLRQPALRGLVDDVPAFDPGAAGLAVLEAPLDPRDGFTAHRGRIAAPDGHDAFVSPWQPNRGETSLRVIVPSAALRDGRHVLVVEARAATGEEPVESYAFRVERR